MFNPQEPDKVSWQAISFFVARHLHRRLLRKRQRFGCLGQQPPRDDPPPGAGGVHCQHVGLSDSPLERKGCKGRVWPVTLNLFCFGNARLGRNGFGHQLWQKCSLAPAVATLSSSEGRDRSQKLDRKTLKHHPLADVLGHLLW